nr:hypothetical protein [Limosilactobacillus mucosae]
MARILGAAPQDDFDRFRRGGTADRWLAVFQTGASQSNFCHGCQHQAGSP